MIELFSNDLITPSYRRRGLSLIELLVVVALIGSLLALALGFMQSARETARRNTCAQRLRSLGQATANYVERSSGIYPGYMNALLCNDGNTYHSSQTRLVEPVSWCVVLLSDLDRQSLHNVWRSGPTDPNRAETDVYLEMFVCPSDESVTHSKSSLSYVANSGMPDSAVSSASIYLGSSTSDDGAPEGAGGTGPSAGDSSNSADSSTGGTDSSDPPPGRTPPKKIIRCGCPFCRGATPAETSPETNQGSYAVPKLLQSPTGTNFFAGSRSPVASLGTLPRDRMANGIFFDRFTNDPRANPSADSRLNVSLRKEHIRDPIERTILFTENVDAGDYVLRPAAQGTPDYRFAELDVGCTWAASANSDPASTVPDLAPPSDGYRINAEAGRRDKNSYAFCRPSSRHPNGINVMFAGGNGIFLSDKISYFVYAKLMSTNDALVALPRDVGPTGSLPSSLRTYQLTAKDLEP